MYRQELIVRSEHLQLIILVVLRRIECAHAFFWSQIHTAILDLLIRINTFFSSSLVCKFKAHKRCAVRATNNCKWTTLASIGKDIIEDEDGVGVSLTLFWKHSLVFCSFFLLHKWPILPLHGKDFYCQSLSFRVNSPTRIAKDTLVGINCYGLGGVEIK